MTLRLSARASAVAVGLITGAAVLLGAGGASAATAARAVGTLDQAPVASDGAATIALDTPTEVTLTAVDPDGGSLTFVVVTAPSHGSLGPVVGNKVTYTPDRSYLGSDSFTFRASDGILASNAATVALAVVYTNHAPVAVSGVAVTDTNAPRQVTLEASDPDADALDFAIVTPPAHGTLDPIRGEKTGYTPAEGYQGLDSFTFKANDGSLDSNLATVVITVGPANHAPIAAGSSATTAGDTAKQVTLSASDPDGNLLTYSIVGGPSHGFLGLVLGNTVVYTPAPGYTGLDFFTFKASDGSLDSNVATVAVATTGTQDPAQAFVPTFLPMADAYVNQLHPNANYGTSTKLYTDASPIVRSYVRFNVSGLDGYQVTRATLRIYVQSSGASGQVFDVHGVSDSSWGETSITYGNAPAYGATVGSSGPLSAGTWASVDVTPLVLGNGPVGVALTTGAATNVRYSSRDGANPPQLVISASPSSPPGTPPTNTSAPTISGSVQQGQTLTASNGTWSGSTPMSFAYQWRRCDSAGGTCTSIAGATGQSYALVAADVGTTMRVVVTASNSAGSSSATSAQTAVVQAAPSSIPFSLSTMTGDRLYTAGTSRWNTQIASGAAVDVNSTTMISAFSQAVASGGGLLISVKRWTVPAYVATSSSPRYNVQLTASWRPANYMLNVPIPPEAAPDPAGDGHMAIFEPATGCQYDFWQAARTANGWSSSWANSLKYDSTSTGVFAKGLSARGSGFATTAGVMWPQELSQGEIRHALMFSYGATEAGGPVTPATESDGRTTTSSAIPEGAQLQLDPSLNLDSLGLTGYERTIAVALQRYGMFLGDTGSPPSLYAINPQTYGSTNPYAAVWGDQTYVYLNKIPADRFRVLALPPQQQSSLQLVDSGCAKMG
jgi:hypothetical protein